MATATHGLPSPLHSASSPAPSNIGSVSGPPTLPAQRQHPLKPGSPKEIALINYVDDKVLYITRRYATKFTDIKTKANEVPGYTSYDQFVSDLNPLVDLVWTTGTPTLQIPYMLTFAGMVASYMPAFPLTTNTFRILKRLDSAFSTLLQEREASGIHREVVSITEKVRIKSIVEETRITAVHQAAASSSSSSAGQSDGTDYLTEQDETSDDDDDNSEHADESNIAMVVSKIYEATISILGDSLAKPIVQPQSDDSIMDVS